MDNYLPITGGPEAPVTQPSIVALPAPKPYDGDRIQPKRVVQCTPDVVAAFIRWLLGKECQWTIRDGSTRRRIVAGDICVLFRRATNSGRDLTEDYVRALEARDIPHVLVGSKGLHGREEILAMRTALRAIEWPEDELSVYAVLRGAFFGIPDNTLFRCRESGIRLRPGAPWPEVSDADYEPVREALEILSALHRKRNSQPIADTIRCLLELVRGHAILAFNKGGVRKLANVHRLAELARQADSRGIASFRRFVEFLEREASTGEAAEAPVIEHQNEGVLLMTAHKAKGLEFPVVILADPTAGLINPNGCDRWVDLDRRICAQRLLLCAPWELLDHEAEEDRAERDEGARVAYVSATRAKDLLVVCAIGDTEYKDGWLSPLYDALYPPPDQRRHPRHAPGCPPFGEETVLNAPPQPQEEQIRPGLYHPRTGTHEVVWFDPAALHLDVIPASGAEREHLLDGNAADIAHGLESYRSWQSVRKARIEAGSTPSLNVRLATQVGDVPEASSVSVDFISLKPTAKRPSGRRFGRLLHALLENGGTSGRAIGRRFGATSEEIEAAERAVTEVMSHPLLSPVGARLLREYPVSVRLEDGTLIEGRADLVRDDGETVTVIDYKTDSDRARAKHQLQLYAYALARATGKPTRGVIFEV
jgi:ATP-dependent exoDNAse (exonuclease V) beta subunit